MVLHKIKVFTIFLSIGHLQIHLKHLSLTPKLHISFQEWFKLWVNYVVKRKLNFTTFFKKWVKTNNGKLNHVTMRARQFRYCTVKTWMSLSTHIRNDLFVTSFKLRVLLPQVAAGQVEEIKMQVKITPLSKTVYGKIESWALLFSASRYLFIAPSFLNHLSAFLPTTQFPGRRWTSC